MKCFLLHCFSSSKRQNHFSSKSSAYTTIQFQPSHLEESIHWISQSKIENEQEKSQFVNNTDDLQTKEITLKEEKQECSDSLFSVSITCGKPLSIEENEVNSTPIKEPNEPMNQSILEYRYQDCSDDGYDDINLDGDEKTGEEEEEEERSSESSLFSLSTDYNNCSSRMVPTQEESEDACSSVLNPIENVSAQVTMLDSGKKDKENMNWNQAETSLKVLSSSRKMKEKQDIGVDTSLSSWLVKSENDTPKNVRNVEDRQILGALKVEEMNKYSSPEETPIIGSVGSYWNHSGKTRSSKSNKHGKDGKQDWSSTTIIKTRLEPAFEASVAQN